MDGDGDSKTNFDFEESFVKENLPSVTAAGELKENVAGFGTDGSPLVVGAAGIEIFDCSLFFVTEDPLLEEALLRVNPSDTSPFLVVVSFGSIVEVFVGSEPKEKVVVEEGIVVVEEEDKVSLEDLISDSGTGS